MGTIASGFDVSFRDYATAGQPASGPHQPVKSEIRNLGTTVESYIAGAVADLPRTVPSVAALRAIDAAVEIDVGQLCEVCGITAAGDAPSFFVSWDATSTATHDGWGIFRPTTGAASTGAGRWLRSATSISRTLSASATPSIANGAYFVTQGGTAITDFADAHEGQAFTVARGDADIVITHNTALIDCGGENLTLTAANPRAAFIHVGGVFRVTSTGTNLLAPYGGGGARPIAQILRDNTMPSIMDFGSVVGDGVADDSAALIAALTLNRGVVIPFARADGSPAKWRFAQAVTVGDNRVVIGDPRMSNIRQGAAPLFQISGRHIRIENLLIDQAEQTSNAHTTFRFMTGTNSCQRGRIKNIMCGIDRDNSTLRGGFRTIDDQNGAGQIIDWMLEDITIYGRKDSAIVYRDAWAAMIHRSIVIDDVRLAGAATTPAIDCDGGEGLHFELCNVMDNVAASGAEGAHAYSIRNAAAVDFFNCRADGVGGRGMFLQNISGGNVFGFTGSLNCEEQLLAQSCSNMRVMGLYVGGRNASTYKPASKAGLRMLSCTRFFATDVLAVNCTGAGIHYDASGSCTVTGFRTAGHGAAGVLESGASNFNQILNGSFGSNTAFNGQTVGAQTARANLLLFDGTQVDHAVGAANW